MPWLETAATVISSIIGGLMVTLLAAYLPRRTAVASSREAFVFALKDHYNTFSKLVDRTRKYIDFALFLQYIPAFVVVLTSFLIPRASPVFIIYATTYIILALTGGRIFIPLIIEIIIKILIKRKRLMKSTLPNGIIDGIISNASATVFTAMLAFLLLLSKLINAKLPWQSDLATIILSLVAWLLIAYFPTILSLINSKIYNYSDYFESDERIPWDLELVNEWLSDPDIRRGDNANGSPFVTLILSLDNGQKLEGRLVRVKKWGMVLEDISKHAKLYIRWERIAAVELI